MDHRFINKEKWLGEYVQHIDNIWHEICMYLRCKRIDDHVLDMASFQDFALFMFKYSHIHNPDQYL